MSDSVAQVWDLKTKQLKYSWTLGGLAYAMFSPNGNQVLFNIVRYPRSNIRQPKLAVYDAATGSELDSMTFSSDLTATPIMIDDEHIVTGYENGDIHVWSYRHFKAVHSYHADASVMAITKDAKGRVWCGLDNGKLLVIENGRFSLVLTFKTAVEHLAVFSSKLAAATFSQPAGNLAMYKIERIRH